MSHTTDAVAGDFEVERVGSAFCRGTSVPRGRSRHCSERRHRRLVTNRRQIPLIPTGSRSHPCPFQPLKSPISRMRLPFGAQTAKCVQAPGR